MDTFIHPLQSFCSEDWYTLLHAPHYTSKWEELEQTEEDYEHSKSVIWKYITILRRFRDQISNMEDTELVHGLHQLASFDLNLIWTGTLTANHQIDFTKYQLFTTFEFILEATSHPYNTVSLNHYDLNLRLVILQILYNITEHLHASNVSKYKQYLLEWLLTRRYTLANVCRSRNRQSSSVDSPSNDVLPPFCLPVDHPFLYSILVHSPGEHRVVIISTLHELLRDSNHMNKDIFTTAVPSRHFEQLSDLLSYDMTMLHSLFAHGIPDGKQSDLQPNDRIHISHWIVLALLSPELLWKLDNILSCDDYTAVLDRHEPTSHHSLISPLIQSGEDHINRYQMDKISNTSHHIGNINYLNRAHFVKNRCKYIYDTLLASTGCNDTPSNGFECTCSGFCTSLSQPDPLTQFPTTCIFPAVCALNNVNPQYPMTIDAEQLSSYHHNGILNAKNAHLFTAVDADIFRVNNTVLCDAILAQYQKYIGTIRTDNDPSVPVSSLGPAVSLTCESIRITPHEYTTSQERPELLHDYLLSSTDLHQHCNEYDDATTPTTTSSSFLIPEHMYGVYVCTAGCQDPSNELVLYIVNNDGVSAVCSTSLAHVKQVEACNRAANDTSSGSAFRGSSHPGPITAKQPHSRSVLNTCAHWPVANLMDCVEFIEHGARSSNTVTCDYCHQSLSYFIGQFTTHNWVSQHRLNQHLDGNDYHHGKLNQHGNDIEIIDECSEDDQQQSINNPFLDAYPNILLSLLTQGILLSPQLVGNATRTFITILTQLRALNDAWDGVDNEWLLSHTSMSSLFTHIDAITLEVSPYTDDFFYLKGIPVKSTNATYFQSLHVYFSRVFVQMGQLFCDIMSSLYDTGGAILLHHDAELVVRQNADSIPNCLRSNEYCSLVAKSTSASSLVVPNTDTLSQDSLFPPANKAMAVNPFFINILLNTIAIWYYYTSMWSAAQLDLTALHRFSPLFMLHRASAPSEAQSTPRNDEEAFTVDKSTSFCSSLSPATLFHSQPLIHLLSLALTALIPYLPDTTPAALAAQDPSRVQFSLGVDSQLSSLGGIEAKYEQLDRQKLWDAAVQQLPSITETIHALQQLSGGLHLVDSAMFDRHCSPDSSHEPTAMDAIKTDHDTITILDLLEYNTNNTAILSPNALDTAILLGCQPTTTPVTSNVSSPNSLAPYSLLFTHIINVLQTAQVVDVQFVPEDGLNQILEEGQVNATVERDVKIDPTKQSSNKVKLTNINHSPKFFKATLLNVCSGLYFSTSTLEYGKKSTNRDGGDTTCRDTDPPLSNGDILGTLGIVEAVLKCVVLDHHNPLAREWAIFLTKALTTNEHDASHRQAEASSNGADDTSSVLASLHPNQHRVYAISQFSQSINDNLRLEGEKAWSKIDASGVSSTILGEDQHHPDLINLQTAQNNSDAPPPSIADQRAMLNNILGMQGVKVRTGWETDSDEEGNNE